MSREMLLLIFGVVICASNVSAQSTRSVSVNASALCSRLSAIKELPFNGTSGVDPIYDALIAAGESVVPCLIEKVGSTKRMRDPRCCKRSCESGIAQHIPNRNGPPNKCLKRTRLSDG